MIYSAIIEIPKGGTYKYEIDKKTQVLKLDRVMPIECPYNYGYIEDTMSGDGDPLDIFIISEFPITPLTQLEFEPIGILICDDNGDEDNKVLAKIKGDKYHEVNSEYQKNIKFYLENYKKGFKILKYNLIDSEEDLKRYITL